MSAPAVRHPGEFRWETRLLAVITAVLVVVGIASTYGAASLQTNRAGDMIVSTTAATSFHSPRRRWPSLVMSYRRLLGKKWSSRAEEG